ncbi:MAG: hypothetical protein ACOC2W_03905 [bacterium]
MLIKTKVGYESMLKQREELRQKYNNVIEAGNEKDIEEVKKALRSINNDIMTYEAGIY